MATTARETGTIEVLQTGSGRFAAPVIADCGEDAWVVLVRSRAPLALGSRFEFAGLDWEIVREPDPVRGFVAWPVLRSLAAC